jgi:hypothetical protein
MLFSAMIQEVKNIVQDTSFDAAIPGYINEAFLQASGRINIPDLKRMGIATAIGGQNYVSLSGIPNGFSGRLTKVLDNTISRFKNIEDMFSWVTDHSRLTNEVGTIEAVTLEGKTLWYFPQPSSEQSISCILFSNPTPLEYDEDEPIEFPEVCHRNIGIHGAAFLCYLVIEDGIEGDKVNTNFHYGLFEKGVQQLLEWVGRHRVHMISSTSEAPEATTTWGSTFARWNNVPSK